MEKNPNSIIIKQNDTLQSLKDFKMKIDKQNNKNDEKKENESKNQEDSIQGNSPYKMSP